MGVQPALAIVYILDMALTTPHRTVHVDLHRSYRFGSPFRTLSWTCVRSLCWEEGNCVDLWLCQSTQMDRKGRAARLQFELGRSSANVLKYHTTYSGFILICLTPYTTRPSSAVHLQRERGFCTGSYLRTIQSLAWLWSMIYVDWMFRCIACGSFTLILCSTAMFQIVDFTRLVPIKLRE